jgi:ribosomal protein S26
MGTDRNINNGLSEKITQFKSELALIEQKYKPELNKDSIYDHFSFDVIENKVKFFIKSTIYTDVIYNCIKAFYTIFDQAEIFGK